MRRWAYPAALLLVGVSAGAAIAQFMESAPVDGNTFATKADWAAPVVSSSVIAKTVGYASGYIKQGGTYYVYANVSDTGNPASGIASVRANVSTITTGQTTLTLTAGPYSVGGVSYNYRSASVTANSSLTAGTYNYSIATSDAAGNSGTTTGLSVVVDNTAPSALDVQTTNKTGGVNGAAEIGDIITFTYSEPMEPNSIFSGWTGASANVVVRLNTSISADNFTIYNSTNSSQLPLGQTSMGRTDYTSSNRTFGAGGTPSTMVMSGSTIMITLGTASGSVTTAAGTGNMSWSPSSTSTDRAANACSSTARTETGTADKDF